jgi:hypothetical protein
MVIPTTRSGRRWSIAEKHRLCDLWPKGVPACTEALGRSVQAVRVQAVKLGLTEHDEETMLGISRETGYAVSRLKTAAKWLKLRIVKWSGGGSSAHNHRVTLAQKEKILSFLRDKPDGVRLLAPTGQMTPAGVWGIGVKPPCCIGCGTIDRPHRAGGRCMPCYQKRWKLWGVDGRQEACLSCHGTKRAHHAAGLCHTCRRRPVASPGGP